MATTQISDVFVPAVWATLGALDSPERSPLVESGIVQRSELLNAKANTGGTEIQVPFWGDLDANREPNASNDDPTDLAAPAKIGQVMWKARVQYLNQGYSAMDLVTEVAGSNPMQRIKDRIEAYWTRQMQRRLIASAIGVMNNNVASDNSDMTVAPAATTGYNRESFVATAFTNGDRFNDFTTIAVHPWTMQQMVNNNDIAYIRPSEGALEVPTFLGQRVIVDKMLPWANNAGTVTTTSIMFGPGAFGWGEGSPNRPESLDYDDRAGNGGGMETLWSRRTWILHPLGFDFTGADITNRANTNGRTGANTALDEFSPLLADLRKAANWDRKIDREYIPLAFLNTTTDTA